MKSIKVKFSGFEDFMMKNNIILQILKEHYKVEESEEPDILFFSVFNHDYKKYDCINVFVSAEPCIPDFNEVDYAISSCDIDFKERHCYYPWYLMLNINRLVEQQNSGARKANDGVKFCNFIYSHTASKGGNIRIEFCKTLMKMKHVDCLGRILHNAEDSLLSDRYSSNWNENKLEVLKKYKFTIAFENTIQFGYTTEKLIDPLVAGSLPIYYGNPHITRYINPNCFVDATLYEGKWDEMAKMIIDLDEDRQKYNFYFANDPVNISEVRKTETELRDFLINIVENGTKYEKDPYDFMNKVKIPQITVCRYVYYKLFDFILRHRKIGGFLYRLKHKLIKR